MPSLRRSSLTRSSPYVSLTRTFHPRRRSAGSQTIRRRVLADIAWWTVVNGQTNKRPVYPTSVTNIHDENRPPQDPRQEEREEPITTPVPPTNPVDIDLPLEFASMSLDPRPSPLVDRAHTYPASSYLYSDDSFSFVESSPDFTPIPLTPLSQLPPFVINFSEDFVRNYRPLYYTPPLDMGCPLFEYDFFTWAPDNVLEEDFVY